MKVSLPYMGQTTAYKKFLELLGHEVIAPSLPTQHTFDLGVLYSPEFICYPFKVMMGSYFEVCEKGAEMIISSGGSGPCRAGLYGKVHEEILRKAGYDVDVVIFDSIFRHTGYFIRQIKRIKNKTPLYKVAKYALFALEMVKYLDAVDRKINIDRAYEVESGSFDRAREEIDKAFYKCNNKKELKKTYEESVKKLDAIPKRTVKESDKVRIGLVGEIYVVMERATNNQIEKRLNALGCEVVNHQTISEWIEHNTKPRKINKSEGWRMWDLAEKYKLCNCGGHDMENTGRIMDYAAKHFDGVIHLMPFGCLPELVTRSLIPKLSDDLDIPILTMSIDEQNGEANTQTRLEAFCDLCKNRKKVKTGAVTKKAPEKETVSV